MPKSKRNKIVHLTQVKKKGKDHKEDLIKQCEQYATNFKRVFLFDFDQAKSDRIMSLRLKLKDIGRIFSGKNSIMNLALRQVGSRANIDFDNLIEHIIGHRGLLFTDVDKKELVSKLDAEEPEFCKKLLGYANINVKKHATVSMEVDQDAKSKGLASNELNESEPKSKTKSSEKTKLEKRSKAKQLQAPKGTNKKSKATNEADDDENAAKAKPTTKTKATEPEAKKSSKKRQQIQFIKI